MDQIDRKIIELLEGNARTTVAQISRTVAMTQPAVSERIRKLEEQGVIEGYRVVLSPKKLGKNVTAFILFKTDNCAKFQAFISQHPAVIEMFQLSGEYNFLMKVVTESTDTLSSFLGECSPHGFSSTLVVLSTVVAGRSLLEE